MEVLSHVVGGLLVMLVLCGSGESADSGTEKCKLTVESKTERNELNRMTLLLNKSFSVTTTNEKDSYTYVFQFCGDAGGVAGAGVVQTDNNAKTAPKTAPTVVGRYDSTKAIGGSDWIMLFYENGDNYKSHCGLNKRKAIVMISCDRTQDPGSLKVVVEDKERSDCFYLFELDTNAVCPVIESKLSAGSIILIVGVCLVAVYLIGGFLYQRLVVGAKGMDQIPNYAFWVEVGNLSADGCDFVCRSRSREEPNAYRGVASEPEEEPEERDDHLLPM